MHLYNYKHHEDEPEYFWQISLYDAHSVNIEVISYVCVHVSLDIHMYQENKL